MNIVMAAIWGVVCGLIAWVVLSILATVVVLVAPFVYPAAVIIGLLVFVTSIAGTPPWVR